MTDRILVFYGSYRRDRQGIRLADYCVRQLAARGAEVELIDAQAVGLPMLDRQFPRFADDLAWWTAAAKAKRERAAPSY